MIRVLVDACLLVKGTVSNVLFDLHQAGLVALHWTPEIGDQFVKNWAKRRIDNANGERKRQKLSPLNLAEEVTLRLAAEEKARKRLGKFELMAVEWRIPGWNAGVMAAAHPPTTLGVGQRGGDGVHAGDYEVALGAICLGERFPTDEIWLATENIGHLPPKVMISFRVWAMEQGLLLEKLHMAKPLAVQLALEKTMAEFQDPKFTKEMMLNVLGHPDHFGTAPVKAAIANAWGLAQPTVAVPASPPAQPKKAKTTPLSTGKDQNSTA